MPYDARPGPVAAAPSGRCGRDEWFADEVVLDFPALQPIVERMREAFFGGADADDEAPRAQVCLTAAQARRGGRVPVTVPVRRVCHECGGRGEIWNEPCVRCGGRGAGMAHETVEVEMPSGVHDGACLAFSFSAPHAPAMRVLLRVSVS